MAPPSSGSSRLPASHPFKVIEPDTRSTASASDTRSVASGGRAGGGVPSGGSRASSSVKLDVSMKSQFYFNILEKLM